jgi:hypothetical protein
MGRQRHFLTTNKGVYMKALKVKITGTAPLLMHSDRFANPLDPLTKAHKELTATRKKTDETHIAIARGEFIGSCYWAEKHGVFIPAQNLESCLINAAKLNKLGVKFKQGVRVLEDVLTIDGHTKSTPESLWGTPDHVDVRGVRVTTSKIMRYRPIFKQWGLSATVAFNEEIVSAGEVKKAISDAGALIGLCDYRPRFGRFSAEVSE